MLVQETIKIHQANSSGLRLRQFAVVTSYSNNPNTYTIEALASA